MKSLTIEQLLAQKRDIPPQFILNIDQQSFEIKEIKRLLPKRRIAALAIWQDQMVFIKLFFGKHYQRYATRELNGIDCFKQTQVAYPQLLNYFNDQSAHAALLVFELIENSHTLLDTQTDPKNLKSIIDIMATLHQKNILQTDIHLDNFLLTKDKIYIIDAGMVKASKNKLSVDQRLNNLATLFIQFSPLYPLILDDLLSHYNALFNDQKIQLIDLEKQILKQRKQRESHYMYKKVFRNCTLFLMRQTSYRYFIITRDLYTKNIENLCSDPDQYLEQARIIKSGRTAKVGIVTLDHKQYLLKRYNRKNWFHFIARSLFKSRAAVSWQNGHLLQLYDIETPSPVALIEQRWQFFRGHSWLLLEYDEGQDLLAFFNQSNAINPEFLEKLQVFITILPKILVSHGDFKAPNILLKKNGDLSFIDLDGMRAHRSFKSFYPYYLNDLERLKRDIGQYIDPDFFVKLESKDIKSCVST